MVKKRHGLCPSGDLPLRKLSDETDTKQPVLPKVHIIHCNVRATSEGYVVLSECLTGGYQVSQQGLS